MEIACPECGQKRKIREDYTKRKIPMCKACTARRAQKHNKPKSAGVEVPCLACGKPFYKTLSDTRSKYCSKQCCHESKSKSPRESRDCAQCGKAFWYRARPHSNNAGRYCSLPCRNASYVGHYRGRPQFGFRHKRAGWTSIRNKFLKAGNAYCFGCGKTTGRLMVHHIEPYRLTKDNRDSNLMTFCGKCHSNAEFASDWIESLPPPCRPAAVLIARRMLTKVRRKAA